ncbi:MAG: glycosyltransferase family 4 protein [Betaproteobacteria bacterium]
MKAPLSIEIERIVPDKPSLRVAVVTETYPPDINGVAHTISIVVTGLRERGHEITLIRPRRQEESAQNATCDELLVRGAPIPMYKQLRMGLPALGSLRKLWTARRPDLVHIATQGPLGWSAARAAHKLSIPVSSDFRTNFHAYSQLYGLGWLKSTIVSYLRKFHNAARCTMVPTQRLKDELVVGGFERLIVVPRGVDTEKFSPVHRNNSLRESWGARPDTVVLLSVGRLAVEKNLGVVVNAYTRLKQSGANVKLIFVGDGPETAALQRLCPDAIFAGTRRGQELAEHYASADLFIFPSLTETFGNVTLEAMSSGLCVVAYDHAAAGQLITNHQNGLLLAPNDEAGFIAAALEIERDRTLRDEMRKRARQTALNNSWNIILARTEEIFRSLVQINSTNHD